MPTPQYNATNKLITELAPNQTFVFGSNASGFHGAGSAGQAMRGDSRNTWRDDRAFLKAKSAPKGHPDRIGKWAVYGVARGHQVGREGQSYAIETITRPGEKRSTPLAVIQKQLGELLAFAASRPDLEILMTPVGCGYSGYSAQEMKACWDNALKTFGNLPENIVLPPNLYQSQPSVELT